MSFLGDVLKSAVNQVGDLSEKKARSMSDGELLEYLDRIDDVRSPIAQDAILNEARRRGLR